MTGSGCGWSKISRVRAPYDNLDPAVKPLQSPESAVYIMDSLLDAAIEGVAIVEADPGDHSVGLGGLPNEDGVVELDAAVMHGPTMAAARWPRSATSSTRPPWPGWS